MLYKIYLPTLYILYNNYTLHNDYRDYNIASDKRFKRTFIIFVGKLSNHRTRPNISSNAIIHISVESSRI